MSRRTYCLTISFLFGLGLNQAAPASRAPALANQQQAAHVSERTGVLLGASPTANDLYDPSTGNALLVPGVPLSPSPTASVRIGVIDSGVIADHPQLRALIVAERAFRGSDPTDRLGHGTSVALQLVANPPYFPILSAKVTDDSHVPTVRAVIAAIDWLAANGASVVNISLGFQDRTATYTDLCEAIARHSDDISFAVAAGNSGPDVQVYPAACDAPNLISVSEVQGGALAPNSGRGDIGVETDTVLVPRWLYHLDLGLRASQGREYSRARREFRSSIATEDNAEARFQLALLDVESNDLTSAATHLGVALEVAPELATLWTHLGAVRFLQGDFADAERLLRRALTLDSTDERAYFNLGQTLLRLSRPAEALAVLEQLREINPDYPQLDAAMSTAQAELD